jgi:hypothetical protein
MEITLRVTDLDGNDRTVVAGFSDLVDYEKFTGKSVGEWSVKTPGVYDFAVLAWTVETGQATDFREWTDTVGMAVMVGSASADPTHPGQSPGQPSS